MRGDPDHPLSHGYTCAKGRALPQLHHHPDRIERPLLRVDGRLQPVSWDECLEQLAALRPPAPLVLIPRRQARKLNGGLDFLGEPAAVIVHPEHARTAGVLDGEPVEVSTDRGALTAVAELDPGIRRGVVSVPHGHHAANVSAFTDKDELDPVTGMVRYSGVPVTLRPRG